MNAIRRLTMGLSLLAASAAQAADRVFFIEPADGATVSTRFMVKFGLEGYRIGKLKDMTPGTGHHHVLINSGPVPKGEPIPVHEQSKHYGTGLTEATLNLPPGEYRLTLQFGDGEHESYGPEASHTITVRVK